MKIIFLMGGLLWSIVIAVMKLSGEPVTYEWIHLFSWAILFKLEEIKEKI